MSEEQTHTGRPAGPKKEKWRDFQHYTYKFTTFVFILVN